jgi:hypothetical protein
MSTAAPLQNTSAESLLVGKSPYAGLLLQRKCACGESALSSLSGECAECSKKKLQRKLSIGASNDPLEQEADRVADQVLAAPTGTPVSGAPPRILRFTGQSTENAGTAPASIDRVLAGSGRSLDSALQQDMGQRFGHDFSQVRVHTGAAAEQSARDVNAHAYTVGNNVVFGAGRFVPGSHEGRRLLAHELAHVMQQVGSPPARLQRDASDEPCGPIGFGSDWSIWATIADGPYADQGITISYDKIAPLSDPMEDFDRAESVKTFKDASRLEQVYHDATQPIGKFKDRWRAAWWICTVVEPVAREIGAETARDLHSMGCLTIQNCGVNWGKVLGNFSDRTASGLRNQTLLLKGFTDKSFEIGLSLQIINSVLLLYSGISAARAGLGKGIPAAPTAPKPLEAPQGVSPEAPSQKPSPAGPTPPAQKQLPAGPTPPAQKQLPAGPTPPAQKQLPAGPTPPAQKQLPAGPTPLPQKQLPPGAPPPKLLKAGDALPVKAPPIAMGDVKSVDDYNRGLKHISEMEGRGKYNTKGNIGVALYDRNTGDVTLQVFGAPSAPGQPRKIIFEQPIGRVAIPPGRTPVQIGNEVEEPVRDLVRKATGQPFPAKPPQRGGPDLTTP